MLAVYNRRFQFVKNDPFNAAGGGGGFFSNLTFKAKCFTFDHLSLKGEISSAFFTSVVTSGEIRPSFSYKIILEQRKERNQLNS